MFTRNAAFPNMDGLAVPAGESELEMDQDAFSALYEETARGMWAFLLRRTGDEHLAEDLLQETYYRFLRTRRAYQSDAHRRHYLFRIASNVANDAMSRRRTDLARAMTHLNPRQREAL
jgi:DNA-directed RNA polymerase specialized sigma24 family protein